MRGDLQPDLFLLDVMMHGLDDFEVGRRIRSTNSMLDIYGGSNGLDH